MLQTLEKLGKAQERFYARIAKPFRKIGHKLARIFVASYADRLFKQAIKEADDKRAQTGCDTFVLSHPWLERKLIVVTEGEFIRLRERHRVTYLKMKVSDMKNRCWYRTENAFSEDEQEVRRLAFVRMVINNAKLD